MSDLQNCVGGLISVFHRYAIKDEDKKTLSRGELKELLSNELGDILGKASDKAAMDKIFNDLDQNSDGVVDFMEYVTAVACITVLCNKCLTK